MTSVAEGFIVLMLVGIFAAVLCLLHELDRRRLEKRERRRETQRELDEEERALLPPGPSRPGESDSPAYLPHATPDGDCVGRWDLRLMCHDCNASLPATDGNLKMADRENRMALAAEAAADGGADMLKAEPNKRGGKDDDS